MKKNLRYMVLISSLLAALTLAGCGWFGGNSGSTETRTLNFVTGEGASTMIAVHFAYGTSVYEPETVPTRDGYRFAGWYIDSYLNLTATFPFEIRQTTWLYARWELSETFYLTFDAGYGNFGQESAEYVHTLVVSGGRIVMPEYAPVRDGFVFGGWYQDSAVTQSANFPIDLIADITLYARWLRTFVLSFDTDGGIPMASESFSEGSLIGFPEVEPIWAEHTFVGWFSDSDREIMASFPFVLSNNRTLYAGFDYTPSPPLPEWTATFHTGVGGSFVAPVTAEQGTPIDRPAVDPVRDGFVFGGWYRGAALTTQANFPIILSQNITIYARWRAEYTVTFDTGTGGTAMPPEIVVSGGMLAQPSSPIRADFEFGGWRREDNSPVTSFPIVINSDITLTAVWIPMHTVTFDTGTGGTAMPPEIVVSGGTLAQPSDPIRADFVFDGWQREDNSLVASFPIVINSDMTLTAVWIPIYTVTFDTMGGSPVFVNNSFSTMRGTTVPNPGITVNANYVFVGWFEAGVGTSISFPRTLDRNLAVYARWIARATVTFDTMGGVMSAGTPSAITADIGFLIYEPFYPPTRAGMLRFDAWYTDVALTTRADFPFALTEDVILYASWRANLITIPGAGNGSGGGGIDWGDVDFLRMSVIVANGDNHSLLIDADGRIWAWGNNSHGQLGTGTTYNSLVPIRINAPVFVVFVGVFASDGFSMAIDSTGGLWAWGRNSHGQLGSGNREDIHNPRIIQHVNTIEFATVALGRNHALAICTLRRVWTWGCNQYGQLGTMSTEDRLVPQVILIGLNETVIAIAAGVRHSVAISESTGSIWAWGAGELLGRESSEDSLLPVQISGTGFVSVSAGDNHTLAIDIDGNLWVWGLGANGRLGTGNTDDVSEPVQIMSGTSFAVAVAGRNTSMAIDTEGNAWVWGANTFGQLGCGGTQDRLSPYNLMSDIVAISTTYRHTHVLTANGQLFGWGLGQDGRLGNGSTNNVAIPTEIVPQ